MIIGFNGEQHDVDEDHIAVLHYPNYMMNGLFIDLDDNYAFISTWQTGADEFIAEAIALGVEEYQLGDSDIDLTAPPHCWVMQSLVKLVIRSAEEMLDGAA